MAAVGGLFVELTRLKARYAVALADHWSCPRDREILRTKIEGVHHEIVRIRKNEAANATRISDEVEVQRMERSIMMPPTPRVPAISNRLSPAHPYPDANQRRQPEGGDT